ncbi:retrovirus-related Pol polyprotein from transposon TNT 1-94 [Trifolium pratense]|uniref:Retrovirus-related Pol polyprotein from transposon TNT 1-94 n=1 Tax=Trifolium pratense TaxID=57577 RepID=A0A2K3PCK0_TRIPR|nr:retrovirus-related Pol polyprotein from transposon TNT 1-94 [Trifolium pratense]
MKRALGTKMKFDFVTDALPMPDDDFDPAYCAWHRCNQLISSWILNSVSPSIAQSVVFMKNASDIWNDLRERFSQRDLVRISELQQEIYALKQETRSVTDFYSDLKTLWEELELYLPIPTCTCHHRCTCEAMRSARRHHSLLQIVRFITSLNDHFSTVKSQILIMDPLPPINKVFSLVIHHERQSNFSEIDDSKILVNAAKNGKFASSSKPSTRNCSYCGKDNHVVENCFKKNGVPPHMKKPSSAHNATVEGGSHDSTTVTPPSISQEQYDKLMSLLQHSNLAPNSVSASSNQDKKCLKMIGSADEHDGLYHLNLTDKVAHVASIDGSNHTSIPKSTLWHFRLGHPSHSRLVSLRNKFSYVTVDHNGICDICHLARKCVFLGYKHGVKGTVLYDLDSEEIFISRNVIHFDHILPYTTSKPQIHWHYHISIDCDSPISLTPSPDTSSTTQTPANTANDTNQTDTTSDVPIITDNPPATSPIIPNVIPDRIKHRPSYLSDFVCSSIGSSTQSSSIGTFYPISSFHSLSQLSPSYSVFTMSLTQHTKPKTYNEACKSENWIQAMNTELEAFARTGTWKIVDLPPNIKPIEGLDFFDTFSPLAKLTTVRMLLAIASIKGRFLHQLDAGRKWYEKLSPLLVREGYTQSTSDYFLFTLSQQNNFTALLIYVDDVILAGTNMQEINRIKAILDLNFKIKDLGVVKYFLGLEVAHSKEGISISQKKYCLDLLNDSSLLGSKPASTLLDPSIKLHQDNGKPFEDISLYRRLAACRVIRYLKHNPGRGLVFHKNADIQLLGYSDADWAGCIDTRKSTTGIYTLKVLSSQ